MEFVWILAFLVIWASLDYVVLVLFFSVFWIWHFFHNVLLFVLGFKEEPY